MEYVIALKPRIKTTVDDFQNRVLKPMKVKIKTVLKLSKVFVVIDLTVDQLKTLENNSDVSYIREKYF